MHYDVIIIGTGAGGGTLAHRLAPIGQADPPARARRLRPAREGQLELARRQRRRRSTTPSEVWHDATASRCTRTPTTTSAATPSSTARRCSACASEDFGELRHHGGRLAGLADQLRRPRAVLHRGRAPVPRARRARRRPDRAVGERARTRIPPVSHEPRIQQLHDDFARGRPAAVPRAARRDARRAAAADEPPASAATPATASPAWSTPRPTRRSSCVEPALAQRQRHAPHRRLRRAPRDERVGPRGHRRACRRGDGGRALHGRHRRVALRRDQLGRAAAAVGQRPAPAGPRQRLRRGRPPLHGPRQLGADGGLALPEPDRVPEDARRSTTSTSATPSSPTRWATSRSSASSTAWRCRPARRGSRRASRWT